MPTHCGVEGCENYKTVPFKCKLCEVWVCAAHRLPENHFCVKLDYYRSVDYKKAKMQTFSDVQERPQESEDWDGIYPDIQNYNFEDSSIFEERWDSERYIVEDSEKVVEQRVLESWSVGSEKKDLLFSYLLILMTVLLMFGLGIMVSNVFSFFREQEEMNVTFQLSNYTVISWILLSIVPYSLTVVLIGIIAKYNVFKIEADARFVGSKYSVLAQFFVVPIFFFFRLPPFFFPPTLYLQRAKRKGQYEIAFSKLKQYANLTVLTTSLRILGGLLAELLLFILILINALEINQIITNLLIHTFAWFILLALLDLAPINEAGGMATQRVYPRIYLIFITICFLLLISMILLLLFLNLR